MEEKKERTLKKEEVLFSWKAPARPFRKRKKEELKFPAVVVGLLILILLFFKEFALIGVLLSLCFVAYVFSTVPPKEIENKITTKGVYSGNHFYPWEQLDSFWFSEVSGQKVLNFATYLNFPTQIFLLLGDLDEDKVETTLSEYIRFNPNPPRSLLDNLAESLGKKFLAKK